MPFSFCAKNTCPIMKGNNKIKGDVSMKKITEIVKDNKVEIALYGTALFWIMENVITGTICKEYDKGGSLETLKAKMLKRD